MSFDFTHPKFNTIFEGGVALSDAEIVVIGFHGRGGNTGGIYAKMEEAAAGHDDVAFFAPRSENKLWFRDQFVPADDPQLLQSLDGVKALVQYLNKQGISSEQIIMVGQSQGAVLVNEYLASTGNDLRAGVSWSGGLVGPLYNEVYSGQINPLSPNPLDGMVFDLIPKEYRNADLTGQTIQMAVHEADAKVPLDLVIATAEYYRSQGANVEMHVEPGTAHTITDYDGAKLADAINYTRDNSTFQTKETSDGGFVTAVVETHREDPKDSRIVIKVCNEDGYSTSDGEFAIKSGKGPIDAVDVAVLKNGNIAFAYVEANMVLRADVYMPDGTLVSGQILASNVDGDSIDATATNSGFQVHYASVYGNENVVTLGSDGEPTDVVVAGTRDSDVLIGSSAGDEMFGYRGDDQIDGLGGNDVIRGGNGRDTIEGGAGNDKLIGQGGGDVLDGGAGTNRLIGGRGADKFVVSDENSITRIMDFQSGVDTIVIDTDGTDDFGDLHVRHLQNGLDLITFEDARVYVNGGFVEDDFAFM